MPRHPDLCCDSEALSPLYQNPKISCSRTINCWVVCQDDGELPSHLGWWSGRVAGTVPSGFKAGEPPRHPSRATPGWHGCLPAGVDGSPSQRAGFALAQVNKNERSLSKHEREQAQAQHPLICRENQKKSWCFNFSAGTWEQPDFGGPLPVTAEVTSDSRTEVLTHHPPPIKRDLAGQPGCQPFGPSSVRPSADAGMSGQ